MFTVVLSVVVIGICVTAVVVEMLSGQGYQPATAGTEPRSPWEPWRTIALNAWRRTATVGRAIGRATRRSSQVVASRAGAAALAAGRAGRRAGLATARQTSLVAQASRRAALRGRATTRVAGRRTATLVVSATRAGARRGRQLGAATAGQGRRIGLAAGRTATGLGRGVRVRARRARIAASSTLASGLGRVEESRTARARRREARATAHDVHGEESGAAPAPDVVHMAQPETTPTREPPAPAPAPAPTAASPDVARPGPSRRTLDGPGQRRRQRSPWPTSPAAGGRTTTRETVAVSAAPAPPDVAPAARALDPSADTWTSPAPSPDADTWIAPGHPDADTWVWPAAEPVPGADPAHHEPLLPQEVSQEAPAALAGRPVPAVPMPVPTRTRVLAGVKLVVLTTVLGVVAAGVIVSLAIAVVSALAGI